MHIRSTSRIVALVAMGIIALGGLVGCSSTENSAAGEAGNPGDAAAFPVTLTHEWGTTTIEEKPERVVALGWSDADTLLALGITPVAIVDWQQLDLGEGEVNPWSRDLVEGQPPVVLPRGDLDFRQIASLNPDLILDVNGRANGTEENYKLLSQIAPTVASPPEVVNNNLPWQDQVRVAAQATGLKEAGEQLIADTEQAVDGAAQAAPELVGKTYTVSLADQNGWRAYVSGDVRPQFLDDLGMSISPTIANLASSSFYADRTMEQTGDLEADVVIFVALGRDAAAILAEPAVQALPAVQEKRYVMLDNDSDPELRAAFATGATGSIKYTLDHLVPRLVAATRGEGS